MYRSCCVKKSAQKMNWWFLKIFAMKQTEYVFWTTCHNFCFPHHMRLELGKNLKIKIQWCCYSSNNIQYTTKAKRNLTRFGLPPKSASLKTLARHECDYALERIKVEAQKRASKEQWQTTFKSNMLPMHGHLVRK